MTKNLLRQGYFILITLFACLTTVHAQKSSKELMPSRAMALIPGGAFIMGSNKGPDDKKPEHTIFIKAFLLDILQVSNADFARFLNH